MVNRDYLPETVRIELMVFLWIHQIKPSRTPNEVDIRLTMVL